VIDCIYCDRPLACSGCGADYRPPTLEHYLALSRPEVALTCPDCERVLACRWCQTPYDGRGGEDDDGEPLDFDD